MGLICETYGQTGLYSIIHTETPDGDEYLVIKHGKVFARDCYRTYWRAEAKAWIDRKEAGFITE